MEYTRICLECENSFVSKRKDKVFCTDLCRANYRHKHPKATLNGDLPINEEANAKPIETPAPIAERKEIEKPKRNDFTLPADVGFQVQYVVNGLSRERDRFEKLLDDERADNKKLKEAKEKLEKELLKLQHDHEIEALRNESEKTSGLQGFGESPAGIKLIETFGPILAGPLGKLMDRWADQSVTVAPKELGEASSSNANATAFINWISTQSEPAQNAVFSLLQALSKQPDENNLLAAIAQIQNLVMGDYMRAAV